MSTIAVTLGHKLRYRVDSLTDQDWREATFPQDISIDVVNDYAKELKNLGYVEITVITTIV